VVRFCARQFDCFPYSGSEHFAYRQLRNQRWKASELATVPGVSLGALIAMVVSLVGAGTVLAASATLFSLLKLAGAAYLIWLAYSLWVAPAEEAMVDGVAAAQPLKKLFWQSFLISALNPKGPVFYVAFIPQFVDVTRPYFQQFGLLTTIFVGVATLKTLFWLFFAMVSGTTSESQMRCEC
jgi:threonine/homoserine/homoserine lactone efflux protein